MATSFSPSAGSYVFKQIPKYQPVERYRTIMALLFLFPQCFLLDQVIENPFVHILDIISLFAIELEEPKIGILGKALTLHKCCVHGCKVEHQTRNHKVPSLIPGYRCQLNDLHWPTHLT